MAAVSQENARRDGAEASNDSSTRSGHRPHDYRSHLDVDIQQGAPSIGNREAHPDEPAPPAPQQTIPPRPSVGHANLIGRPPPYTTPQPLLHPHTFSYPQYSHTYPQYPPYAHSYSQYAHTPLSESWYPGMDPRQVPQGIVGQYITPTPALVIPPYQSVPILSRPSLIHPASPLQSQANSERAPSNPSRRHTPDQQLSKGHSRSRQICSLRGEIWKLISRTQEPVPARGPSSLTWLKRTQAIRSTESLQWKGNGPAQTDINLRGELGNEHLRKPRPPSTSRRFRNWSREVSKKK